jgi:hypothetical protein
VRRRLADQPGKGLRRVAGNSTASTQARLGLRPPGRRHRPVRTRDGKKPVRPRWDWTQLPLVLTALAAVGALYFNTHQTSEALQATRDQVGLSEQGQITDRFSKAVEQLGTKDSLEVRLGGIYALERIARDSARDHPTVMEVLLAYVREHAPLSICSGAPHTARPTTDVQAILTVIGRRDKSRDRDTLALSGTCLANANLTDADLTNADLTNAALSGADLSGADLSGWYLFGHYYDGANLTGVNLTDANLSSAELSGADLSHANLSHANLSHANLTDANLTDAYLTGVNLRDTRGLR